MKKMLQFGLLCISIVACISCTNRKVEETAVNCIKTSLKNPESFQLLSIEIRKDTIPAYFAVDAFSVAKKFSDAIEDYTRYSSMGKLWKNEALDAAIKVMTYKSQIKASYRTSIDVENVAYIKYSATNALGGRLAGRAIVIVDKDNVTKDLGIFDVDDDFRKAFLVIKMTENEMTTDFLQQNEYGKYNTEDWPYIEQFIMQDAK